MKNFRLLFIALCGFLCVSTAISQLPAPKMNPSEDIWKWDTIVAYNLQGEQQRLIEAFNAGGNVSLRLNQHWSNNAWADFTKSTYSYDSINRVTTELKQAWQNNAWVDLTLTKLKDTAEGFTLKVIKIVQTNQSGAWVNTLRNTHVISTTDFTFTETTEEWHINDWINVSKLTSWIDAINLKYGQTCELWNVSEWVNSWKDSYTVNLSLELQSMLHQVWAGGSWTDSYKNLYANDASGNVLQIIRQQHHSGSWADSSRTTWTYDNNGNSLTGKYEIWQTASWQQGIGKMKVYYSGSSYDYFQQEQIDDAHRYVAKYIAFPSGITDFVMGNLAVTISPNPATDKLTVSVKDFKNSMRMTVYDIHGRLRLVMPLLYEKTEVDISKLESGIYIARLISEKGTSITRFIKK
ncbi:MAG: T9SS type A sorting domain-containing protein [Bacteroidota bacterium]